MLSFLILPDPRPPAADEALAAWCAAALRAGALPALRRLMATARPDAPVLRAYVASAASLLALIAAEPAATAAAGAGGMPEVQAEGLPQQRPDEAPRWRDDPAVATAIEILLGFVTGAPAC
jgi:hypothetical protein